MAQITKSKADFDEVSVEFDLGETVQDPVQRINYLIDKYSAPVIASLVIARLTVAVQSKISNILGKDPSKAPSAEQVQSILNKWKPGIVERAPSEKKKDTAKKFLMDAKSKMSKSEFLAFLKEEMGI